MPAIHLFGRRTLLGGDDLQVPCMLALLLRVIQLLALLIPVWWHIGTEARQNGGLWHSLWYNNDNDFECRTSHMMPLLLFIYTSLTTLLVLVQAVGETRLLWASNQGCPTERQPRSRTVESMIEFKLVPMGIVQCLILVLGITVVCFAQTYYRCRNISTITDESSTQVAAQEDDFWNSIVMLEMPNAAPAFMWWIAYALLWGTLLAELVVLLTMIMSLFAIPSSTETEPLHHELVEAMWAQRCTNLCECLGRSTCFLFGGRNMAMGNYGDVARAMADYVEGSIDLVPSDILMGLMVLQKIQRQRILHARVEVKRESEFLLREQSNISALPSTDSMDSGSTNSRMSPNSKRQSFYIMHQEGSETFYESTSRKVLNMSKTLDRFILQEGARFSRYQLAIYTWLLYLYGHPFRGVPRLMMECVCRSSSSRSSNNGDDDHLMGDIPKGFVLGDNCCQTHKTALMLQAGIDDETTELVYAQLYSSFSEIPYCIIIDHAWKSVVLAIRGTFSLEDCVADVLIDPSSLEEMGREFGFDGRDQYCHGGIMSCAQIVHRDLLRHKLLHKLLIDGDDGEGARYPDYSLRVVGHSLGAGTATLVSYMLRPTFPTLRCINYSPPGCSFTWKMATQCQDWCSAFVLDNDLVPRLSLPALEHLRDEVLEMVGRVKVPKAEVARRTIPAGGIWNKHGPNHDTDALGDMVNDLLMDADELDPNSPYQIQLSNFKAVQLERRITRGESRSVVLYPPGRLVHFMKTGELVTWKTGIVKCLTCCTTNYGSQYTPIWVQNNDFNEIVVSPTMGTDHFPTRLTDTMEMLVEEYGLDTAAYCDFDALCSNMGLPI